MQSLLVLLNSLKEFFAAKMTASTFLTCIIFLFGQNLILIQALFILIIIDFITGILKSLKNKCKISSSRMQSTIKKIILYSLFLIATNQMTRVSCAFDWLHIFAGSFLAVTELLSIIENLAASGILIPKWLIDKLHCYLESGEFTNHK